MSLVSILARSLPLFIFVGSSDGPLELGLWPLERDLIIISATAKSIFSCLRITGVAALLFRELIV